MIEKIKDCLAFDDVLIEPKYSEINSRKDIDLSSWLSKELDIKLSLPIISSPMDTVTEHLMGITLKNAGGIGIIHRYNTIANQLQQVALCAQWGGAGNGGATSGAAIGVSGDYLDRAKQLTNIGCSIICIDVAHGHHENVEETIKLLRNKYGNNIHIIAGNVATYLGARDLASWGADSIRVGLGGSGVCSTRINTGHGIPTFQSVLDCSQIKESFDVKIIADGGHRTVGDIVKSLAAGADFVMLGGMLAGTDESPGELKSFEISELNSHDANGARERRMLYKVYRGMASIEAQQDFKGQVNSREGITVKIPYKGSVNNILKEIETNLRSGLSYSGANNIYELQQKATFIKQSHAGIIESSTHIKGINL